MSDKQCSNPTRSNPIPYNRKYCSTTCSRKFKVKLNFFGKEADKKFRLENRLYDEGSPYGK